MAIACDEQLVQQYLDGDEESFEVLVARYLKPIYAFAYRTVGNAQDAEDIAQEVFVKVWKNLKKFDRRRNFRAWIYRIAHNTAVDVLRKKRTIPFSAFENEDGQNSITDTLADAAPLPPELFDRQTLARDLGAALDRLPPAHRAMLFLRYNDHFTFQKIAALTGESIHTVKSRHQRAVIALRKLLV